MPSQPETIRAFIASRMSEEVERALSDFIDELRARDDAIRWARRSNLHVTLKFLGPAVDSRKIGPLADRLSAIARETAPFDVRTAGIGGFPDLVRPRVIWAGLDGAELAALAARIDDAAAECGFERERREWSAHLTIGRVRDPRRVARVRDILDAAHDRDFGHSRIDAISLYRSHLGPDGSTYETLASFALTGR